MAAGTRLRKEICAPLGHAEPATISATSAMRTLYDHEKLLDGVNPKESLGRPLQDVGTRQLLLSRLGLALRIAERTIQFLGADGFHGADLPEGNFAAEKPLAETAMLL